MSALHFKMYSDTTLLCSVQPAGFLNLQWGENSLPARVFSKEILRQAKIYFGQLPPSYPCHEASACRVINGDDDNGISTMWYIKGLTGNSVYLIELQRRGLAVMNRIQERDTTVWRQC